MQTNADEIRQRLSCGGSRCECKKPNGHVHCPAHEDEHPSLSVTEKGGKVLVHCFTGCDSGAVIQKLQAAGLWHDPANRNGHAPANHAVTGVTVLPTLTVDDLVKAKCLDSGVISAAGVGNTRSNTTSNRPPCVSIPYMDENGRTLAVRYRLTLEGDDRFRWRKGDKVHLYGLWRMKSIRTAGWVLLVEGETDCWTCWQHDIPALGVPGKSVWRGDWARMLDGLTVYIWQEPDAQDFTDKIVASLPDKSKGFVIVAPRAYKDLNACQCANLSVPRQFAMLREGAVSAEVMIAEANRQRLVTMHDAAQPVLECPDPIRRMETAITDMGYGGDTTAPKVTYLAFTSRLLRMRTGAMPVHTLVLGPPSSGKSYALSVARSLFPPEAYHQIDAASPRALIYDDTPLSHKVIIFGEADSLPAGEDNPAASAVRTLLQEHHLGYDVVERDEQTGKQQTVHINREGPSVLVTTAVRKLGDQLDSRVFTVEVPDDQNQVRAALRAQANIELFGSVAPDPALVAYQAYLQAGAPWDVTVPYVGALANEIGRSPSATRINRDFARLVSLVKSVALLRHAHRARDAQGRIVADLDDYDYVRGLIGPTYAGSVSGASAGIRAAVDAVEQIAAERKAKGDGTSITGKDVGDKLGINKMQSGRYIRAALKGGWLVNLEDRKNLPYKLQIGEPLPPEGGLPDTDAIRRGWQPEVQEISVTADSSPELDFGNTVTPNTDRSAVVCVDRTDRVVVQL